MYRLLYQTGFTVKISKCTYTFIYIYIHNTYITQCISNTRFSFSALFFKPNNIIYHILL